jgi:hypothetical protein
MAHCQVKVIMEKFDQLASNTHVAHHQPRKRPICPLHIYLLSDPTKIVEWGAGSCSKFRSKGQFKLFRKKMYAMNVESYNYKQAKKTIVTTTALELMIWL